MLCLEAASHSGVGALVLSCKLCKLPCLCVVCGDMDRRVVRHVYYSLEIKKKIAVIDLYRV